MKRKNQNLIVFTALVVLQAPIVLAQERLIEPYVASRVSYDDNYLKFADSDDARAATGSSNTQETTLNVIAGLKGSAPISRQKLTYSAEVNRSKFDRYDDLDNTAVDGSIKYDWQVGNQWDGELSYRYDERLTRFLELNLPLKDMETRQTAIAQGGYLFHPRWRLAAGASWQDRDHNKRSFLDRTVTEYSVEQQYFTSAKTRVALRAVTREGDEGINANDYDETEFSGVVYWEGTTKSHFEGRLGKTKRDLDNVPGQDFSGITWDVIFTWMATPKTKVLFSAADKTANQPEISSYSESRIYKIEPVWNVSEKLTLTGYFRHKKNDFTGLSVTSSINDRKDTLITARVGAKYKPTRQIDLLFAYVFQDRDSNISTRDFDSQKVTVGASYTFR